MPDKIPGIEPKYKVGDVVKTSQTAEKWQFIEDYFWIDIDGDSEEAEKTGYHYKLRSRKTVAEVEITDIMDALPD